MMTAGAAALLAAVESFDLAEEEIRRRQRQVHDDVLQQARHIFEPNFTSIHTADLELLFDCYDRCFFRNRLRPALDGPIGFRASPRLTRAGGKTTRFHSRLTGERRYEIAVAIGTLFDGFRGSDREASVGGVVCGSRLEAMQRIFEHELVHLVEMLSWDWSNCAGERFQRMARRLFLHEAHTHSLVTRYERAAGRGIRPGAMVRFAMEGKRYTGRVNRITKRATVLVEDAAGRPFTDGKRYAVYYVPIGALEAVE
jgi:hypothetical protein